jgi:hypothetical protein
LTVAQVFASIGERWSWAAGSLVCQRIVARMALPVKRKPAAPTALNGWRPVPARPKLTKKSLFTDLDEPAQTGYPSIQLSRWS